MWLYLGIGSAIVLGVYDIFKKLSLQDNDVLTVLFLSNVFSLTLTLPVFLLSWTYPDVMTAYSMAATIPAPDIMRAIGLKSLLVSASWICAFFSLKHLPISIVSPIRASAPMWTLLGAIGLFGERLHPIHWLAVILIFGAYYAFSIIGKAEGIRFASNRWIYLIVVATLLGAASALYDKYLLQELNIPPVTLQVWFSFFLVGINGTIVLIWHRVSTHPIAFKWHPAIPLIGICLIVADFFYFAALHDQDALVSILSVVRRGSVAVSFTAGGLLFREKNKRKKAIPLGVLLVGIALLVLKHPPPVGH